MSISSSLRLRRAGLFALRYAVLGLGAAVSAGAEGMRGPPADRRPVEPVRQRPVSRAYPELLAHSGIALYQSVLRRYIPSDCPMEPSCSEYARNAIVRHGPGMGVLLAADRLLHEKTEGPRSPKIWRQHRGWCSLDPVEKHTRWWRGNGH